VRILCVFGEHAYGDPSRGTGYEYANFLPALRALGHEVELFDTFSRRRHSDFAAMNAALVDAAARLRPELMLFVLMGYEVWTETLDLLRDCSPAVLVNWSTDDSWKYEQFSRFVAPHFDLYVTTDAAARSKALAEGMDHVVLSQWAASGARLAEPLPARQCPIRVSFVGARYGNRPRWIASLRARGVEVQCFGHGWPAGPVDESRLAQVLRGSVISLNFGDSPAMMLGWRPGHSRQIKARVFEVPGAGGFLLSENAERIGEYYRPGTEIALFGSEEQLAAQVRRYLDAPDERDAVARAGHARTAGEHTYESRFATILQQARERGAPRAEKGWSLDGEAARARMRELAGRHATTPALRALRGAAVAPLRAAFGARRGPRAARRLLFEASWRFAGARTYGAAGLPGRLFYAES